VIEIPGEICEFTDPDGYVHKYRHYRPLRTPKAYVIALHGIQSHSGWYDWSSSRLAEAGIDVRFLDRRGAGLNELDRGHADRSLELLSDVYGLYLHMRTELRIGSRKPIVLTSVSWSGKLAAGFVPYMCSYMRPPRILRKLRLLPDVNDGNPEEVQCSPFDGVALLYPAIFTHFDPNAPKRSAIRTAHALGLGRKSVSIPLDDPALFTDDSKWQQFIRDDPLALRRVSLSFLNATLQLTKAAERYPDLNPPPTFLALAGRDEIVDLPRTRKWAARLPTETTRIVEYPDARHTLEFDACREQFVADLIDWIESLVTNTSGG
jgi:alpha-beta hydrolase superfamily lysophospholipase